MINIISKQVEREEIDRSRNLAQIVSNAALHGITAFPIFASLYSAFYNQNLATSFQDERTLSASIGAGLAKLIYNVYRRSAR
jgi:hypothetical protein